MSFIILSKLSDMQFIRQGVKDTLSKLNHKNKVKRSANFIGRVRECRAHKEKNNFFFFFL